MGFLDGKDLVLLVDACKEFQVSNSISVQPGLISDLFPWKKTGLAKLGVGVKGIGSGPSRVAKVRMAKAWVGSPGGPEP